MDMVRPGRNHNPFLIYRPIFEWAEQWVLSKPGVKRELLDVVNVVKADVGGVA